ncbi:hypothetical protein GCM10020295_00070 [Streptomyces cinereospinus]
MLDGEIAHEVALVVLEPGEVVDLLGQPLGQHRGGAGELVRAGEDQGLVACGGVGAGVGAFPFGSAFGVPPGVDLVQGPLVAVGQAAGVGFLSAVGEPAAQVQALVVFDPPGARCPWRVT